MRVEFWGSAVALGELAMFCAPGLIHILLLVLSYQTQQVVLFSGSSVIEASVDSSGDTWMVGLRSSLVIIGRSVVALGPTVIEVPGDSSLDVWMVVVLCSSVVGMEEEGRLI